MTGSGNSIAENQVNAALPVRRSRGRTLIIVVALGLLAISGLSWGWWYLAQGRFPLAGDLSHDFGVMPIYGQSAQASHTFHLRNRTDQTIHIEALKPSCGCTNVAASTMTIPPAGEVDIDVTLSLASPEKKKTHVSILMRDQGVQSIWVSGTGRMMHTLVAGERSIAVMPGELATCTIYAAMYTTDDQPPVPEIRAPQDVDARFRGWERTPERSRKPRQPARWIGTIAVSLEEHATLDSDAAITIALPPAEPIAIALNPGKELSGRQGEIPPGESSD